MSLYILVTTKNIQKVLLYSALLFVCFFSHAHAATESNHLALYVQGSYSPIPTKPTCSLTAKPASLSSYLGKTSTSTLTWSTTGTTKVVLTRPNNATSSRALNGSIIIKESGNYTIAATGSGGTTYCSKFVGMIIMEPKWVTCTLTATPKSIKVGQTSTLAWTSQNANMLTLTRMVGTSVQPLSGTFVVKPKSSFTYSIKASNTTTGMSQTCTAPITVTAATPAYMQSAYYSGQVQGASTDIYAEMLKTLSTMRDALRSLK